MVFFVSKNWSDEERQIFIALQFARWYYRSVIKYVFNCFLYLCSNIFPNYYWLTFRFTDLLRVCDEIENIIQDYIIKKTRGGPDLPESIYFASALRRMLLNPAEHQDRETRHLCHVYVDVALKTEMNAQKRVRYVF